MKKLNLYFFASILFCFFIFLYIFIKQGYFCAEETPLIKILKVSDITSNCNTNIKIEKSENRDEIRFKITSENYPLIANYKDDPQKIDYLNIFFWVNQKLEKPFDSYTISELMETYKTNNDTKNLDIISFKINNKTVKVRATLLTAVEDKYWFREKTKNKSLNRKAPIGIGFTFFYNKGNEKTGNVNCEFSLRHCNFTYRPIFDKFLFPFDRSKFDLGIQGEAGRYNIEIEKPKNFISSIEANIHSIVYPYKEIKSVPIIHENPNLVIVDENMEAAGILFINMIFKKDPYYLIGVLLLMFLIFFAIRVNILTACVLFVANFLFGQFAFGKNYIAIADVICLIAIIYITFKKKILEKEEKEKKRLMSK